MGYFRELARHTLQPATGLRAARAQPYAQNPGGGEAEPLPPAALTADALRAQPQGSDPAARLPGSSPAAPAAAAVQAAAAAPAAASARPGNVDMSLSAETPHDARPAMLSVDATPPPAMPRSLRRSAASLPEAPQASPPRRGLAAMAAALRTSTDPPLAGTAAPADASLAGTPRAAATAAPPPRAGDSTALRPGSAGSAAAPQSTEVHIHIGRIEFASPAASPAEPRRETARKPLSLDDYLRQRRGRKGGGA